MRKTIKNRTKKYKAGVFLQAQAENVATSCFHFSRDCQSKNSSKQHRTTNEKCLTSQVKHERDEKKPISNEKVRRG